MGLLDDAIREHLELKRSRGADPGELARAEQEALEPVFPDEHAEEAPAAPEVEHPAAEPVRDEEPSPSAPIADFSSVGQETAEIDMSAVLAEEGSADAAPGPEEIPGQERLTFE